MLLNQFAKEKGILKAMVQKFSSTKDIFKDTQLKDLNYIILTHNFDYTCLNYDKLLDHLIDKELSKLYSLKDLIKYLSTSQVTQNTKSIVILQNLFISLNQFESKQFKTNSKFEGNISKTQKKRYGKCGQQIIEVKQQIKKQNLVLKSHQNSWKSKIIAEQQVQVSIYNKMVKKLNCLSEMFITTIKKLISKLKMSVQEKHEEYFKWINNLILNNLSIFLTNIIKHQTLSSIKKQQMIQHVKQIITNFFLYAISQIVKLVIVLHHYHFQENKININTNQEKSYGYDSQLQEQRLKIIKATFKLKECSHYKGRSMQKSKSMAQVRNNRNCNEFRVNQAESRKQTDFNINPFSLQMIQKGSSRKNSTTIMNRAFKIVLYTIAQTLKCLQKEQLKQKVNDVTKIKKQEEISGRLKKCKTTNLIA